MSGIRDTSTKYSKMKLLLTRASGFIGKNFIENAPKDIEITAIYNNSNSIKNFVDEKKLENVKLYKCDFTKKKELEALFQKIGGNFEYCIYLAGNVNVPLSITNPIEDLNANAAALINFLSACGMIGRLVYMSSAAVYDGNKGMVTAQTMLDPVIPYCISKLAAEQYIKFFSSSITLTSLKAFLTDFGVPSFEPLSTTNMSNLYLVFSILIDLMAFTTISGSLCDRITKDTLIFIF